MVISYHPADEMPPVIQRMWEVAYSDFERADILLAAAKKDPTSPPEYIARRESEARTRRSICKAINFMITNADDINKVIARKRQRTAQAQSKK